MRSRFLLTLLASQKVGPPGRGLTAEASREQGFSLAVVLVSMLAVLVSSVALANRTQTGLVTASVSGSNREAREVADAGITYVISEWNRPENRGMFNALQPMTAWNTNNKALRNPCNDKLEPTQEATSDLKKEIQLDKSNNRIFKITRVSYRDGDGRELYGTEPDSNLAAPESVNPLDVAEAVITVEGTYKKGSLTSTARATRGFRLDTTTSCGNITAFSFGGMNPKATLQLNTKPKYYIQGANGLISQEVTTIYCAPISSASSNDCPSDPVNGIAIAPIALTPADKAIRNPPSITDIVKAANDADKNANIKTPSAWSINISGSTVITITGEEEACFNFKGASHCNISGIRMRGGSQVIVDTTLNPVYLYVTGNIDLQGTPDVFHRIKYKDGKIDRAGTLQDVVAGNYDNLEQFQEDAFRLQIRGRKATGSSQSFDFGGVPSANLLYWAPNANLSLGGNSSSLASAIYVNSLRNTGSAQIELISQPESFGFSVFGPNQGAAGGQQRKTVAARSAILSQYFE
jgi:hypothetical protein